MAFKKEILFMLFLAIGFLFMQHDAKAASWWDTAWLIQRAINLTNAQSYSLPVGYPINVTMDTQTPISQGKIKSDCSDIRFIDSANVNILNFTIMNSTDSGNWGWNSSSTCNTKNTTFEIKLNDQLISTMTIFMYYDNAGATWLNSVYNVMANKTFNWFDWTNDANKTAQYSVSNVSTFNFTYIPHNNRLDYNINTTSTQTGTYSFYLNDSAIQTQNGTFSAFFDGIGHAIFNNIWGTGKYIDSGNWLIGGAQTGSAGPTGCSNTENGCYGIWESIGNTRVPICNVTMGSSTDVSAIFAYYELEANGTTYSLYVTNSSQSRTFICTGTVSDSIFNQNSNLGIVVRKINTGLHGESFFWSNITLRKSNSVVDPSIVIGTEQSNINFCIGSNNLVATFNHLDEETLQKVPVNMTLNLVLNYINQNGIATNFSTSFTGNTTYQLCILTQSTPFSVNGTLEYFSIPTYPTRNYYFVNTIFDINAPLTINLYSENSTFANAVEFQVVDSNTLPVINETVSIQRFFIQNNSYITVAMIKSDQFGNALTYLRLNTIFYKYVMVNANGILDRVSAPSQIIQTTSSPQIVQLITSIKPLADIEKYIGLISSSCIFTNVTSIGTVSCTYNDPTQSTIQADLIVSEKNILGNLITNCTNSAFVSSATLNCGLGNVSGRTFYYTLTIVNRFTSNTTQILQANTLDFPTVSIFGTTGILIAMMLILILSTIGIWNPAVSISMSLLGLVFSWILGLVTLEYGTLVALVVSGGILIWKLKT